MRRGEVMGLTWDRIDLSRGVLQLATTKNGRRREIPMNRAVSDVLATAAAVRLPSLPDQCPGGVPGGHGAR
jgi:integrase